MFNLSPFTSMSFNSFLPQIPQEETDNKVLLLRYPFPKFNLEIVILIMEGISFSAFSIVASKLVTLL